VLHLRIVAPAGTAGNALEVLTESESVCNLVHLPGAAKEPEGDLILADVAREDASVVLEDLKALDIRRNGSISVEEIDVQISRRAERAVEHARGAPSDAVVWEEVQSRTSEATELSASYLIFMVVAGLIAGVGIYLDSPILIVGAMVVGPEFGPIAGFCVAAVTRRRDVALRSFLALAVGFPTAITAVFLATLLLKALGIAPEELDIAGHSIANVISSPDFLAFFVAACAGVAGVLSLSTAKSGALIGVLISVTTIPAASCIGVAAAYGEWEAWRGSMLQLAINVSAILMAGTLTLGIQRLLYDRRRERHLREVPAAARGRSTADDPEATPGRTVAARSR
jgi:uncharacterized hydrophobic protein (TIGR00271 family)